MQPIEASLRVAHTLRVCLRVSKIALGTKNGLAPDGDGFIYVVSSECNIWWPCELHNCIIMKIRDFSMVA